MVDFKVDIQFERETFDLTAKFELEKGQVGVVLGASGCGKSSLLRLIAGLEVSGKGSIECYDETWLDSTRNINKSPQQRSVGFVFQDFALFENMTVRENIGFGVSKQERGETVDDLIHKLNLANVASRYPSELSGGQKQRVALGRALAIKPKLLLLDEPLSAIDHGLRKQLQKELKDYIKAFDCPVILVTHDLQEARFMADKLIVMSSGRIARKGAASVVFNNPVNRDAAETLGWQNFLPVRLAYKGFVTTDWGKFYIDTRYIPNAKWITIKPEKIRFGKSMENSLRARVSEIYDMGMYKEYHCKIDESLILIVHRPECEPSPAIDSIVNLHLSSQYLTLINSSYKVPACFDANLEDVPRKRSVL